MTKTNQKQKHKKRKRKLRPEAVVILILGSLLIFLLSAMALSLLFTGELPEIPGVEIFSTQSNDAKKVVVIDPGHGGYDDGGVVDGVSEKDVTLAIGLELGALLEKQGYQVVYTRKEDIALGDYELEDLSERVAIGEQAKGDVMISLHTNKADGDYAERIYGFEIYENEQSELSQQLAQLVATQLDSLQFSQDRGVKDGENLQVVALNQVPSILVELGFLDDDGDRAYLMDEYQQKKIAKALAEAIDQCLSTTT